MTSFGFGGGSGNIDRTDTNFVYPHKSMSAHSLMRIQHRLFIPKFYHMRTSVFGAGFGGQSSPFGGTSFGASQPAFGQQVSGLPLLVGLVNRALEISSDRPLKNAEFNH